FTRDIAIGGNRYSERIQQDLGLSLEDAEAAKKGQLPDVNADALHQAVATVDEELATEISRSFDYFRTTSPEDIARIVLCGGCSKIKSLPVKISEHLGIETSVANPFKKLDTSALKKSHEDIERIAPEDAVVVGLSLQREGNRWSRSIVSRSNGLPPKRPTFLSMRPYSRWGSA